MTDTPLLAVGQVASAEGLIQQRDTLGRVAEVAWCPAGNYSRTQPAAGVTIEHCEDWVVGSVVAYDRSRHAGLVAAMTVKADHEDLLSDGDWYLSPQLRTVAPNPMRWERAQILDLSIVRHPGNVQTRPLCLAPLDSALAPRGLPYYGGEELWARAKELAGRARYRSAPASLEIHDLDELSIPELMATDRAAGRQKLDAALARRRAAAPAPVRIGATSEGRLYRHWVGGTVTDFDYEDGD